MKILITGGGGFIGKVLNSYLVKFDYDVLSLGDEIKIDLVNELSVKKLPKFDVIIHLGAKSFVPDSFSQPDFFYKNNINSTINVLEKAKTDNSKVIFLSTYVYGHPDYLPINENHKVSPLNPYTESKYICERLCVAYNRDFGVPITIFRPFNVYGPGQASSFFIPQVLNQLSGKIINLKDSRPRRDFIYVDDVVNAIEKSIFLDPLGGVYVFNLATGVSTSVRDIVEIILKYSHQKPEVIFSNEYRKGEILDTVADITRIKSTLNWNYKYDIELGLKSVVSCFRKK